MAERRPLVLVSGVQKELPVGDQVPANTVYTDTGTSGTRAKVANDVTVSPTGNSASVVFGRRDQITWSSTYNLTSGGWLTANESVVNLTGSGTIDKVVANLAQVNATHTGTATAVLGYEAEIAAVAAGTTVAGFCGFYFPTLRNVANIGNVVSLGAFVNDDPIAFSRTKGQFFNSTLQEFAPPYHPGLLANRYYSAPHRFIGDGTVQGGIGVFVPVYIPHRCTVAKLGFRVSGTAVGAARAVMAIYTAEKGKIQNLVWQSAEINAGTLGDKEVTPNVQVDAGTYWLCILPNTNFTASFHQVQSIDLRVWQYGSPASNTSDGALERLAYVSFGGYSVGAFPAKLAASPSYVGSDSEPHLWFRV